MVLQGQWGVLHLVPSIFLQVSTHPYTFLASLCAFHSKVEGILVELWIKEILVGVWEVCKIARKSLSSGYPHPPHDQRRRK